MKPIRRLAVLAWLAVVSSFVGADEGQPANPPERSKGPGMAVFYRFDAAGEPVRENPVSSGFALDSTASHQPPQPNDRPGRPAAVVVVTPDRPRTRIRIEIPDRPAESSFDAAFEAFRCERHGFFSTSSGRCVVPAFGRTKAPGVRPHRRQRSAPIGAPPP